MGTRLNQKEIEAEIKKQAEKKHKEKIKALKEGKEIKK
jgi:hypothetical protein